MIHAKEDMLIINFIIPIIFFHFRTISRPTIFIFQWQVIIDRVGIGVLRVI